MVGRRRGKRGSGASKKGQGKWSNQTEMDISDNSVGDDSKRIAGEESSLAAEPEGASVETFTTNNGGDVGDSKIPESAAADDKSDEKNGGGDGYHLFTTERSSEKLFSFYKNQGLVPEDEWDQFVAALQRLLPSSFRLVGCKESAKVLDQVLHERYIDKMDGLVLDDDGTTVQLPFRIPWYPDGLGYQMNVARTVVRKNATLNAFHNFLVTETEVGNISRQETVSMVPPLLLDVQPHHKVFDMCAAPGSKTMQLIEALHSGPEGTVPEGFVVANDSDNSRCYMLVHQAMKRMPTPVCVVVNHDASIFPNLRIDIDKPPTIKSEIGVKLENGAKLENGVKLENPTSSSGTKLLQFDRVLCDVVCSGDGTLRKNPDLWRKWSPALGNSLHSLQFRIARRGLQLLATGGLMVYSTCSLNPVEDEAILVQLLDFAQGAVELVNVSSKLPELKRVPGVCTWKVFDRDNKCYDNFDCVPTGFLRTKILKSMFPPQDPEQYHLERSFRILPHHQDTGGFFVAVLRKVADFPWLASGDGVEQEFPQPRPRPFQDNSKKKRSFKEDPFVFLTDEDSKDIRDSYGLSETFPHRQLLGRTTASEQRRNLYFVNSGMKSVLERNTNSLKVVNAGVRVFSRSDAKLQVCRFRMAQEGISLIAPFLTKRILTSSPEDMSFHKLVVGVWLCRNSISPYVSKEEKIHILRILGEDTSTLGVSAEAEMTSKRKQQQGANGSEGAGCSKRGKKNRERRENVWDQNKKRPRRQHRGDEEEGGIESDHVRQLSESQLSMEIDSVLDEIVQHKPQLDTEVGSPEASKQEDVTPSAAADNTV